MLLTLQSVDITACDELWMAIESSFKLVEQGTSPDGCRKLTADLKTFKSDLDTCLKDFYQLQEVLVRIVDKYELFTAEYNSTKECVGALEKRRAALNKTVPDSVEQWQSHCDQIKVCVSLTADEAIILGFYLFVGV